MEKYVGVDVEVSGHPHENSEVDIFYDGKIKIKMTHAKLQNATPIKKMINLIEHTRASAHEGCDCGSLEAKEMNQHRAQNNIYSTR